MADSSDVPTARKVQTGSVLASQNASEGRLVGTTGAVHAARKPSPQAPRLSGRRPMAGLGRLLARAPGRSAQVVSVGHRLRP